MHIVLTPAILLTLIFYPIIKFQLFHPFTSPTSFLNNFIPTYILIHLPSKLLLSHTFIQKYISFYGVGESGFNCWGVKGPALVLFLF